MVMYLGDKAIERIMLNDEQIYPPIIKNYRMEFNTDFDEITDYGWSYTNTGSGGLIVSGGSLTTGSQSDSSGYIDKKIKQNNIITTRFLYGGGSVENNSGWVRVYDGNDWFGFFSGVSSGYSPNRRPGTIAYNVGGTETVMNTLWPSTSQPVSTRIIITVYNDLGDWVIKVQEDGGTTYGEERFSGFGDSVNARLGLYSWSYNLTKFDWLDFQTI